MDEKQSTPPPADENADSQQSTGDAWDEVGKQFQTLGESLAAAFRAAWNNEETRRGMQEMKTGLESMTSDISEAVKQSTGSPEAQELRQQASQTAQTARQAGKKAFQEAQPHLVAALDQINTELQKLVDRLESADSQADSPPEGAPASDSASDEE